MRRLPLHAAFLLHAAAAAAAAPLPPLLFLLVGGVCGGLLRLRRLLRSAQLRLLGGNLQTKGKMPAIRISDAL